MSKKKKRTPDASAMNKNTFNAGTGIFRDHLPRLLPLLLIVALVPLIMRMAVIPVKEVIQPYWNMPVNTDFFSYYKYWAFMAMTILAFLVVVISLLTQRRSLSCFSRMHKIQVYAPLSLIGVMTILSTILSDYPGVSLRGFPDRYEGLWIWLFYLLTVFIVMQLLQHDIDVKILLGALFFSAAIIGLIGLFQFFGYDLLRTELAARMIIPREYADLRDQVQFDFGAYTIYSTLYNSNNVGSYFAMLLPLSLVCFLFAKSSATKMASGIFSCLMFVNWLGCRSRAGWAGGIIAILLILVLFRRKILRDPKSIAFLFAAMILIGFGMNAATGGSLLRRISLEGMMLPAVSDESERSDQGAIGHDPGELVRIETIENSLLMEWHDDTVTLLFSEKGFVGAKDGAEGLVDYEESLHLDTQNLIYTFPENGYAHLEVDIEPGNPVILIRGNNRWTIAVVLTDNGLKGLGNNQTLRDLTASEAFGFEGYERIGSARGYIFSRSIPLLKNTLLVGNGPDTFAMYFPQNDLAGKIRAYNRANVTVDKPHNVYLQIGINQGLIALFAYLSLLLAYAWNSFRLYAGRVSSDPSFLEASGIGCLLAVVGYSVAGLFNDSLISVSPVFWVLLGMGIAVNEMVKQDQDTLA